MGQFHAICKVLVRRVPKKKKKKARVVATNDVARYLMFLAVGYLGEGLSLSTRGIIIVGNMLAP